MSVFPKDERLDEIGLSRGQPCFIHPCWWSKARRSSVLWGTCKSRKDGRKVANHLYNERWSRDHNLL